MDLWDFKKWRKRLRLSQFEAADKLGVSRGTIQHWESERYPISRATVLACEALAQDWYRRPEFGPVQLFYADEPIWPDDDSATQIVCLIREIHTTNSEA